MKIEYKPQGINNFHNSPAINLVISGQEKEAYDGSQVYIISDNQANRVCKHFCGIKECRCSAGGVIQMDQYGHEFGIRKEWCEEI